MSLPPPSQPDGAVESAVPEEHSDAVKAALSRYWRTNVTIMAVLLTLWAIVGLGCGVLFADKLNQFHLGGYPLGFWFAQQGSIITFVFIILTYCILLNRLDRKHHEELKTLRSNGAGNAGGTA